MAELNRIKKERAAEKAKLVTETFIMSDYIDNPCGCS